MFPSNLIKKPKMDSKRAKAIAFFNNKSPNSPIVEKSGFWTLNRVKILFSAAVALIAAWTVEFDFPQGSRGKPFLALLASIYIVAPFVWSRLNKCSATKIKKTKFVKVVSRAYRQSELPCGIVFSAVFLSGIVGMIMANFVAEWLKETIFLEYMYASILILPYLMYNLLCFIGNHPLSIFTAIKYLPARFSAKYQGYDVRGNIQELNYNTSSSSSSNDIAPNGLSGNAGWDQYHYDISQSYRSD